MPGGESSENGHSEEERRVSAWVRGDTGGTGEKTGEAAEEEYVSWRERDLSVRQPRGWRWTVRALAYGLTVTGFIVLLMDVQRDPDRCHPNCFDGSDNTFESGHVWTAYFGAWQWEAQLVLGWIAFIASLWALYVAGRRSRRHTVAALGVTLALIAVWIVWLTVQPSPVKRA
jgi:hypothetical protein